MAEILFQDEYEPPAMLDYLKQSVLAVVGPLNREGMADYYWVDMRGHSRQWERKQVGEAIGDLDAVEEQLNRELGTADEVTLVVEGLMTATEWGVQVYDHHEHGEFCRRLKTSQEHWCMGWRVGSVKKPQPGLWARWEGLKDGLRKAGVDVVETSGMYETASALVAAFKGSFKEERTTLRRYVRPHISPFSPNLHVDNLARLKGAGIGPGLAQVLVERYGTFIDAVTAEKKGLEETIGPKRAEKFLNTLGRYE